MLAAMDPELQKQFEHVGAYDMIVTLKEMFLIQARTERYEISKALFACKMAEGSSVSQHMIKMVGYAQRLEKLGFPISKELGTDMVLASLPPSFGPFIMNYNMNGMDKTMTELHGMLKSAEEGLKKDAKHVMLVNKTTSFKKKAKPGKKGKAKVSDGISAPKPAPSASSAAEAECFFCKEKGH
jgi:hypothetical protein